MSEPAVILDYVSPPHRRASAAVALIYMALLTALLQLMFSHAGFDAPLRAGVNLPAPLANVEAQLTAADADPRSAEIHFIGAAIDSPAAADRQGKEFGRVYYTAQYLRYPHRVLVGMDDQIINNQDQLLAADQLPSEQWLKLHDVSSVYRVYDPGLVGPQLEVRPVR